MMNDLPEWLATLLILTAIVIVMVAVIALLVRGARWALLEDKRSEYEKWSGDQ